MLQSSNRLSMLIWEAGDVREGNVLHLICNGTHGGTIQEEVLR